ncbi:EB domain-containing protein [Strongyloides ratti]|uniref:EB domain-containing protein n=1 Tax=Strongyloides ratti TaxID=34506 RepID=A0A090MYF1_STRRB|nr:EB domain-containing protein [Strongyloides ratti]CEF67074.1 EB domain-containing protein [Strongyloides ratti]
MKFFFATLIALAFTSSVQGDSVSNGRIRRQVGYGFGAPVPACSPTCLGGATCVRGACACAEPTVVYSPVVGCSPLPMPAMPVPTGRLIPQAIPGAPCGQPGVECTGGSICSLGVCVCPPELVQEGTVCVLRQVYGVVPPPPPVAVPVAAPLLALGAPCAINAGPAAPACVSNAMCYEGTCRCAPQFTPTAGGCIMRK